MKPTGTMRPLRAILGRMDPGDRRETDGSAVDVPDAELIRRARSGDREAFAPLVEAHLPQVWSVVFRILRHQEDTEDVVQEVFLAAYQALPSFRGEARLSTWLHRIAVTRALNHLDRSEEKIRRASQALEEGPPGGAGRTTAPSVAAAVWQSRDPSPLKSLEAGEIRRRLAECLGKLPAAWRAVLALRDVDRISYEEIAQVSRIALGTVRSRLARARLALRDCMEAEG
jgi:RNA polymerase sigma-70 factor (ECF subfamily)